MSKQFNNVSSMSDHSILNHSLKSKSDYWSVDSQPNKLSVAVSLWRAPLLLLTFSILAAGLLFAINNISFLAERFPSGDLILAPTNGTHSVSLRIFILAFFASFTAFSSGPLAKRLKFGARMVGSFIATCIALDLALSAWFVAVGGAVSLTLVEVLSGLIGFAIFARTILHHAAMPTTISTEHLNKRHFSEFITLVVVAAIAGTLSYITTTYDPYAIEWLQHWALLGGIGPGVFMFIAAFYALLFALGRVKQARYKLSKYAPPVTVIVPAHNEEYVIGRTIDAIDIAAAKYAGILHIIIANNNSSDETGAKALEALGNCRFATGYVINVLKAGKAAALNEALSATATDYVIRIDADTQVDSNAIRRAMTYFKDPNVGAVGGMPTASGGSFFDRARAIEVIVKHGFYSVALSSVGGVVGIPGMFSAYRTELVRDLGGFVGGMNGEDTDMSMRIGELGMRLIVDSEIRYESEVPQTYRHMREQRMRWFRSTYHVSSRCGQIFHSPKTLVRGRVILPYMLLNSGRRAMMLPLLFFGAISLAMDEVLISSPELASVIAVVFGAPALVAAFSTFATGKVGAVIGLPHYIAFRLLRAYFTLESHLSISLDRQNSPTDNSIAAPKEFPKRMDEDSVLEQAA